MVNLPTFDQSRKDELTPYGEAVRLSNELRSKPHQTFIDRFGNRIEIPSKTGFDCETADFIQFADWLVNTNIKKSESLISFIHRILAVRFPTEYAQYKDKILPNFKTEFEMIQSEARNEVEWIGQVGFQNMVRLDKSLNNPNIKVIINKNKSISIIEKS